MPPYLAPCRPNCVARTVQFEGRRRIFLFSDGPLAPGTELSYDYKLTCDLLLDKCKVERAGPGRGGACTYAYAPAWFPACLPACWAHGKVQRGNACLVGATVTHGCMHVAWHLCNMPVLRARCVCGGAGPVREDGAGDGPPGGRGH